MDALNREVLEPRRCYSALRHVLQDRTDDGKNHYTVQGSWLAVATTPEAVARLRAEPPIVADNCRCCYCCDCCYNCTSATALGGV